MAETKRMTADDIVSYVLEDDGADFLRESLKRVVQQLMEAEVSELVGVRLGKRTEDRATHRNGYRGRRWDTRTGDRPRAHPAPANSDETGTDSSPWSPGRKRLWRSPVRVSRRRRRTRRRPRRN
jgi:hypothetical protein